MKFVMILILFTSFVTKYLYSQVQQDQQMEVKLQFTRSALNSVVNTGGLDFIDTDQYGQKISCSFLTRKTSMAFDAYTKGQTSEAIVKIRIDRYGSESIDISLINKAINLASINCLIEKNRTLDSLEELLELRGINIVNP